MGRRSVMKRREKRRKQKLKKKMKMSQCSVPVANASPGVSSTPTKQRSRSPSSWGSPGTPPSPSPSPLSSRSSSPSHFHQSFEGNGLSPRTNLPLPVSTKKNTTRLPDTIYGMDEEIKLYMEDEANNFSLLDGHVHCLTSEEFIQHLRKCNRVLANKADMYRKKYESSEQEMSDLEIRHRGKLHRVRHFYQQRILQSDSRSATMLKKALKKLELINTIEVRFIVNFISDYSCYCYN